jgi:hypothetical protein
MINTGLPNFVSNLSDEVRHEIIADYVKYEQIGSTPMSTLRKEATNYQQSVNLPSHVIVHTMERLAFECYRYYYEKERTAKAS